MCLVMGGAKGRGGGLEKKRHCSTAPSLPRCDAASLEPPEGALLGRDGRRRAQMLAVRGGDPVRGMQLTDAASRRCHWQVPPTVRIWEPIAPFYSGADAGIHTHLLHPSAPTKKPTNFAARPSTQPNSISCLASRPGSGQGTGLCC